MHKAHIVNSAWVVALGLAVIGCSDGGSGPSPEPPAVVDGVSLIGNGQIAIVGQALWNPIGVSITDNNGAPISGITVDFAVSTGGGSIGEPRVVTNAEGIATTTWIVSTTAGSGYGSNAVTATLADYPARRYSIYATSVAGPPAAMAITSGDSQSSFAGMALSLRPTVRVVDVYGNPVGGASVNWAVTVGGGTVSPLFGLTGPTGEASTVWTLGSVVGANSQGLNASVAGLSGSLGVTFSANAAPAPAAITKISGDLQTGEVGQSLPQPLIVLVQDAAGGPMVDMVVTWEIPCGWYECGSVWSSTTNAAGQAFTTLVLGTSAGTGSDRVYASVAGLPSTYVTFTASAVPGSAYRIEAAGGSGQAAPVGTALPIPIGVIVWDEYWNPKSGVTVNWAAASGSGTTTVASSVTDATGQASSGWTIGNTVGTNNQIASATVAGLAGSPVTFTASATAGP